jgi:hypothetical protein
MSVIICSVAAHRCSVPSHSILNEGHATQSPPWACSAWLPASDEMPDLVAITFAKPDLAVWTARNGAWASSGCWQRELADCARKRDAPDLAVLGVVVCIFGKPDVPIWSSRDTVQVAEEIGHGVLADRACGSDTPDLVVPPVKVSFGIPEVAVGPGRDTV